MTKSDMFGIWQEMPTEGPVLLRSFWQIRPETLNASGNLRRWVVGFLISHQIFNILALPTVRQTSTCLISPLEIAFILGKIIYPR